MFVDKDREFVGTTLMAAAAMFSSLRRQRLPTLAFPTPVDISNTTVLETLRVISAELVSSFSGHFSSPRFYWRYPILENCFHGLFGVKELYLLLYRCKILIDYANGSSKLWLLLYSHSILGHFHDLN